MSFSSLCRLALLCAFALARNVFAQDPAALPIRAALEQTQVNGLHKFYRVDEHIYRSAQPSREGLQALPKLGIKTVIDLRGASERASESELLGTMGIKYVNIPMPALGAPSLESVKQALALLIDQNAWPILIHCERGADRTGTVIACLRISQDGWSNQKALDEAKKLGLASIQTAKKHFILNWPAAATASSVQAHTAQAN
ncbi:MAG: tyrosine-protein phosphatase [Bryobacteraceae bacterium]